MTPPEVCRHYSKWVMVTEGMCAPCRRRTQTCVGQLELPIVTIIHNPCMPSGGGLLACGRGDMRWKALPRVLPVQGDQVFGAVSGPPKVRS
jgi:hypothetical protein